MSFQQIIARVAPMLALLASGVAGADEVRSHYNMPAGVTKISHEVLGLHMMILYVVCAIGVVVFGAMFWAIIFHRRSKHPKPADFHESTTVEIIWTLIPFVVLVAVAIPAAGTLVRMEDASKSDMSVKITGFQWGWKYDYIGEDISFTSTLAPDSNAARQLRSGIDPKTIPNYLWDVNNPLVLPVGKKIRFLITGQDVIHAWWVFDLAVKRDAIPGIVNESWTKIDVPGTYRGVCAELCGRDHGFMPIVVKALPEAEYKAWIAQKKGGELGAPAAASVAEAAPAPAAAAEAAPAPAAEAAPAAPAAAPTEVASTAAAAVSTAAMGKDDLMAAGKKAYETNCQACHQANGQGLPPNFPSLVASKVVNGPVKAHIQQVLKGKNLMPPFAQLSDADIAAAVSYERNSWGNKAGLAQPADVKAAR